MPKFERLYEDSIIPQRATKKSAGYDLHAYESIVLYPNDIKLVKTGVTAEMEDNLMLEVRSRSGLALKGIQVFNSPGTVDADYYPKEIGVILHNASTKLMRVNVGDRIAQGVFTQYFKTDDDKAEGERTSGFGSTGV